MFSFFPNYRYCGPGKSGPGAPINELDAICAEHDACYETYGSNRMCDELFLERIRRLANQPNQIGRDAELMRLAIKFKTFF